MFHYKPARPEYRDAQRDANCRVCDNDVLKGTKAVFWFTYRNCGQNIVICPSCVEKLYNLLPKGNNTNE